MKDSFNENREASELPESATQARPADDSKPMVAWQPTDEDLHLVQRLEDVTQPSSLRDRIRLRLRLEADRFSSEVVSLVNTETQGETESLNDRSVRLVTDADALPATPEGIATQHSWTNYPSRASAASADRKIATERDFVKAGAEAAKGRKLHLRLDRFGRRYLGFAAVAASLLLVLVGIYHYSRPSSQSWLAGSCIELLESAVANPEGWVTGADSSEYTQRLSPLSPFLQPGIKLVGSRAVPGKSLLKQTRLWKLRTTDGTAIYIVDVNCGSSVDLVRGRLHTLTQASGAWSLAALRVDEQVLVIAVQNGRLERYLRAPRTV